MTNSREARFQQLIQGAGAESALKRRAIRGGIFTMAGEAVDFILRIGSIAILARMLVPEHFGLIGMVMAITAVAERFKDLGLSIATVQRAQITHQQVSTLFWINAGLGVLTGGLVALLAWPISVFYGDERLVAITLAIAATFVWSGLTIQHLALLRRSMRFGTITVVHIGASALSIVVAIVVAMQGYGYWALVVREVARSVFVALGTWACMPWVPSAPSRGSGAREMLGFGGHLTVVQLASLLSLNLGHVLVGRFFGAHELGVYRQGFQLVLGPMAQLTYPIDTVSEATLSRLQQEPDAYRRFYRKLVTVVSLITMPLVVMLYLYSVQIVDVVLGHEWSMVAPLFQLFALAVFLAPAVSTTNAVMVTCGHGRRFFWVGIATNLLLAICTVVGVSHGMQGVAAAHVWAFYLLFLPRIFIALSGSPVTPGLFFGAIARPLAASLIMAVVVHLVDRADWVSSASAELLLGATVGAVTYFLAWVLMPGGGRELINLFRDVSGALRRGRDTPPNAAAAAAE